MSQTQTESNSQDEDLHPPRSRTDEADTSESPKNEPRNLVLCFDGSGAHYGPAQSNSNVVKLFLLLDKSTKQQLCYYQPGIGTGEANGMRRVRTAVEKRVDFAIASHLEEHVTDGYKWLMQTYQDGDRIYLFGFSRGSYTARSLAAMLERVGLLGRGNDMNVPFAFRIYSKPRNPDNDAVAAGFKETFSRAVKVHFVGVWDTVASVGLFIPKTLPAVSGNSHIGIFRHAVSIDECRMRFEDNLWSACLTKEEEVNESDGKVEVPDKEGEREADILEVWFAGTHADVGGSWPDDPQPPGAPPSALPINLSVIPLRWMVREALKAGVLMKPEPLGGLKCEEDIDRVAACATLHNTLPRWSVWWVLEYLPMLDSYVGPMDDYLYKLTIHRGQPRKIPEDAKLHRSVEIRNKEKGYIPAGGFPKSYTYVD